MIHRALRQYKRCKKCPRLAANRRNIVLGMGEIPASVLFIGEAPGKTEDLLGQPFVGKSGSLLRVAIKAAVKLAGLEKIPSFFITNILACRPTDEWMGPNREPTPSEIARCRPRLAATIALVNPIRAVLLGNVADSEARKLCPDGIKLRHPAYVARRGGIGSCDYRIFVRGLVDVFQSIDGGNET